MIKVSHLSYSYDKKKKVLDDISFDANKGDCLILLGPNGSGKSTLLKCLLGINKIKEGKILYEDKNLNDYSPREIPNILGYVPQSIHGNSLTVKETIELGRLSKYYLYPTKEDKEYVNKIIEEFNLKEIQDKQTNEISGGERQISEICRAFAGDSSIILFDEPTSNLDIKAQITILNLIKKITRDENKLVIISMHDISQALAVGNKFIFLKDHQIYKIASKEEIDEKLIEDVYQIKVKLIKEGKDVFVKYENE